MKKLTSLLLAFALVFALVGCGGKKDEPAAEADNAAEQTEGALEAEAVPVEDNETEAAPEVNTEETGSETGAAAEVTDDTQAAGAQKSEGVMTYAEYMAADLDTEVVVETYVQAKQSWWEDKATVYTQDEDGAYFVYNMACSEEDYEKLTPGTKIKVTGYKAEWSGEVEIIDAAFEIVDGNYIAQAEDVTALLGSDELINHQNKFVSFKGMTVEAKKDADGNEMKDADGNSVAFVYNWDGSGQDGDDLYFDVSLDGNTYTFTVESYLCDNTTDVYNAVKGLNIGYTVDMEGFLYWYEGVNPHITSLTVK